MHHPALIRALVATACALPILAAAGCKEEPTFLFDEKGAWKLLLFKLEDGDDIGGFGSTARNDKYMIFFDDEAEIVATAACLDSMGNQGVTESSCDVQGPAGYACRCFEYEFTDDQMKWTEFVPKGQPEPPTPSEEDLMAGVADPKNGVVVHLEEYNPDEYNNTFRYSPLPFGVFNSNGTSSQYVFQSFSEAKFDVTGCRKVCGIEAEAAPME